MSYNPNGTPAPSSKPTSEERKGLLSNFDVEDDGGPPRYGDEEYLGPRERSPLRKSTVPRIVSGFVALIIGIAFFLPMSSWCGKMASRLMDPSRLLSNGTHDFKHTVLIVSIDGLR